MQTDRVDAPRADGSSHKVLHERRESSDAPLSADESGIASGGHKQLYIDSQNDKYDNRHDSELTNYHKPLFSEVRINDDEVVL